MTSVKFPEANCELAKGQPEYQSLHVFVEQKTVVGEDGKPKSVPWSMTACFELSEDEIREIVETKRIYHTQMVFGNLFQPVMMTTRNPFIKEQIT